MYRFRNILIPLHSLEPGQEKLGYVERIAQLAESQKAYFIHIASTLNIPEEIKNEYPELVEPLDEYAEKKLQEKVDKNFAAPRLEKKFSVMEGNAIDDYLMTVVRKDIDLVVSRKIKGDPVYEHLPEKLARKAPCSVLILPEEYKGSSYSRILVPIDFSEDAEKAIDVALAFAKAEKIESISAVHVYRVPTGYHKSGKSFENFAEIMKRNAEKEYEKFMEKIDTGPVIVKPVFILNENIVKGIMEAREETKADLVVLSTRGRSSGAAIIMSSYAEKIIQKSSVPVLAVKEKGAGLNFLKALLEI